MASNTAIPGGFRVPVGVLVPDSLSRDPKVQMGHSNSVRLVGGPCDGWEVQWLDSGSLAYFMGHGDPHPHGYYLTLDGKTAVWQGDALREFIGAQMGARILP